MRVGFFLHQARRVRGIRHICPLVIVEVDQVRTSKPICWHCRRVRSSQWNYRESLGKATTMLCKGKEDLRWRGLIWATRMWRVIRNRSFKPVVMIRKQGRWKRNLIGLLGCPPIAPITVSFQWNFYFGMSGGLVNLLSFRRFEDSCNNTNLNCVF